MREQINFVFGTQTSSGGEGTTTLFQLLCKLYHPKTTMPPDSYMLERYYQICQSIKQEQKASRDHGYTLDPHQLVLRNFRKSERITIRLPLENADKEDLLKLLDRFLPNGLYREGITEDTVSYLCDHADLMRIEEALDTLMGYRITGRTRAWTWEDLFEAFGFEFTLPEIQKNLHKLLERISNETLDHLREQVDAYIRGYEGSAPVNRDPQTPERRADHEPLEVIKKNKGMDYRDKLCIFLDVLTRQAQNGGLEAKTVYAPVCLLFRDTRFPKLKQGKDFVTAAYEYYTYGGDLNDFTQIVTAYNRISNRCRNRKGLNMNEIISDNSDHKKFLPLRLQGFIDAVALQFQKRFDVSYNYKLLDLSVTFPNEFLAASQIGRQAFLYASLDSDYIVLATLTLSQQGDGYDATLSLKMQGIEKAIMDDIQQVFSIDNLVRSPQKSSSSFTCRMSAEHDDLEPALTAPRESRVPLFQERFVVNVVPKKDTGDGTFDYVVTFDKFLKSVKPTDTTARTIKF